MKVKEYLVNRILDLERDLKQEQNEYAGLSYQFNKNNKRIDELNEKIEQYQIEREHIKQIITCNIELRECKDEVDYIDLDSNDDDFKTLLAILNIKPEDYKEVTEDAENTD